MLYKEINQDHMVLDHIIFFFDKLLYDKNICFNQYLYDM